MRVWDAGRPSLADLPFLPGAFRPRPPARAGPYLETRAAQEPLVQQYAKAPQDTKMMQQWRELKAKHPDSILLYRCGDFYETFAEDAEVASRVLGLTLTSRNNGGAADVPLAGVPVKALQEYLRRLVRQGFRVAICEQVEDPRVAKGIVRREVVETITPGAAFSDDLL